MPSHRHEAILELFRHRPALAAELVRGALHVALPPFTEVRTAEAALAETQPAEYRADLVVTLHQDAAPSCGIIVEVQLGRHPDKPFTWPLYVAGLRARLRCDVYLLVVTPKESVARWARTPIRLNAGHQFVPLVIGPAGIPAITDPAAARDDPELAVLSAMAHGRSRDRTTAARIAQAALAASAALDPARSLFYCDLVWEALSQATRKVLRDMDLDNYEYRSDFARRYFSRGKAEGKAEGRAEGKAEGKAEGRAEVVLRLLTVRFGPLSAKTEKQVRGASIEALDRVAERVLTARSLNEVFRGD